MPLTELFTNQTIEGFSDAVARLVGDDPLPAESPPAGRSDPDLEQLLAEIEAMSDAEATALLAELESGGPTR